jgi:pyrroloquinoline quinone biosynthesis protein B
LLGVAAGGGLPQWNCGCANCRDAGQGRIKPLTQSSVAVSDDTGNWVLINVSPDVAAQIRLYPDLQFQPKSSGLRDSPISEILLTNADLDHVLGIFSLREGKALRIHSPAAVRHTLDTSLNLTSVMNTFCGITWYEPPQDNFQPLAREKGKETTLAYRAIPLPGKPPLFDVSTPAQGLHSVAYQIEDRKTGGRLLVAPDVSAITDTLLQAMQESDAVIFDGTFWSEDELSALKPGGRTATDMGHVTIKDTSMSLLRSLKARHKIYIHINNTNPVLSPRSPERASVEAAGIQIGHDGLEFAI